MLVLRQTRPDVPRKFTTPLPWVVGIGGILGCAYLFISLPVTTQMFFVGAQILGLLLYVAYSGRAAERARANG
jgi:APA family basic amino acid/polyamine antiporter